jgi:hypothetical protein
MGRLIKVILSLCLFINISIHGQNSFVYDSQYGLYFESIDSSNKDLDKFSRDNHIYKIGNTFLYSIEYKDKNHEKKNIDLGGERTLLSGWKLTDSSFESPNNIKYIKLKVISINDFFLKSYNQTPFEYYYLNRVKNIINKRNESAGLIENAKNTWLHPPRENLFMILEMNPFPFVQCPIEIGKEWECSLTYFGDLVGNENWISWDGYITDKRVYNIVSKEQIVTPFGILECYRIEATSTSKLGVTHLTSYYNEKYGFLKLAFKNIDSSTITMDLIEAKLK